MFFERSAKKYYILLALAVLIFLLPAGAYADVATKVYDTNVACWTSVSDISESDTVITGCMNGSVLYLNATGGVVWRNATGANVTKIIINPAATYWLAISGQNVTYGSASNGVILAQYRSAALADADLSYDGTYWAACTNKSFLVRNTTNGTIASRDMVQNASDTGNWTQIVLDPQKTFALLTKDDAAGSVQKFTFGDNSANWYQNYNYRRSHNITGSVNGYLQWFNSSFIRIYNSTGTTTGTDIYIGSKANTTLNDIYLTESDGVTKVEYVQNEITNTYRNISPRFANLTQSQNRQIYIYYGNTSVTSSFSNATGIVGENISWISIANTTWNWDLETSTGWTAGGSLATYGCQTYIGGDANWSTEKAKSILATASQTGSLGVERTTTATWSSSALPGVNGSFGYHITYDWGWNYSLASTSGTVSASALISNSYAGTWNSTTISGTSTSSGGGFFRNESGDAVAGSTITASASGYAYSTGTSGAGTVRLDNIRFRRWVNALPTAGVWGDEQTKYSASHQATVEIGSTIRVIDMSWQGSWFAASTDTRMKTVEVTASGFGTTYYSTQSSALTSMRSGYSTNTVIEGRVNTMYIYDFGAIQSASATLGSTINTVDISETTGLFAVVGSLDNNVRIYSKSNSSSWYYYFGVPTLSSPRHVSMSSDGLLFAYGIDDTNITVYNMTETTSSSTTNTSLLSYCVLHVYRDGVLYADADVQLSDGGTTGASYTLVSTGRTDTTGRFVWNSVTGNYYKVEIIESGATVKSGIYQASPGAEFTMYITSSYINATGQNDTVAWNNATDEIDIHFTDTNAQVSSVIYTITDAGTNTTVSNTTFTEFPVDTSVTVPNITSSYYVKQTVVYSSGSTVSHTRVVFKPNKFNINVPLSGDMIRWLVGIGILFIAGMATPRDAKKWNFVLLGFVAMFRIFGWMPGGWPYDPALALCVVLAILWYGTKRRD